MQFFEIIIAVFVLSSGGIVYGKELPSYLELCRRKLSKKELEACMIKNIEILRPKLIKGIPELALPSVDPLLIPEACLHSGNFHACFKNLKFYHGQEFVVKKIDINLQTFAMDLVLKFPRLRILSDYDVNGRILILELNGKGTADGNYTNIDLSMHFEGQSVKRRNKEFINFEKQKIDLNVESATIYFDNIFGDNEELTVHANKIINDNIKDIIDEFRPVIAEIISKFIISIVENVFSRYSINELFPDS